MVGTIGKAKKTRGKPMNTHRHRKPVVGIVDDLVIEADVVIEVLDSRFIEKTRNIEVENKTREMGKKLIYIFNKADLVDIDKLKSELDLSELKPGLFFSTTQRMGSATLRRMIKVEAGKLGKEVINVGVVGYPNTGKSSLINLLVGKKVSGTSPESGYTRGIQKIKISKGVYLIDTPGVIPLKEKSMKNWKLGKHLKIGATTWYKAKDPEFIVFEIMKEYPGILEKHYDTDSQKDSEILVEILGRKWNFLKKGNEVDEMRTSKKILRDWQEGKIRF